MKRCVHCGRDAPFTEFVTYASTAEMELRSLPEKVRRTYCRACQRNRVRDERDEFQKSKNRSFAAQTPAKREAPAPDPWILPLKDEPVSASAKSETPTVPQLPAVAAPYPKRGTMTPAEMHAMLERAARREGEFAGQTSIEELLKGEESKAAVGSVPAVKQERASAPSFAQPMSPWIPTKPYQIVALVASAVILLATGWPLFSLAYWNYQYSPLFTVDLYGPANIWRWHILAAGLVFSAVFVLVAYWPRPQDTPAAPRPPQ
jgi:hypothetical protein